MRELGHFLIGYTLTRLLYNSYLSKNESISKYKYTIPILGGIWAMLPDLDKNIPVPNKWYDNIFFFHKFLDDIDVNNEPKNQYPIILSSLAVELYLIKNIKVNREWYIELYTQQNRSVHTIKYLQLLTLKNIF